MGGLILKSMKAEVKYSLNEVCRLYGSKVTADWNFGVSDPKLIKSWRSENHENRAISHDALLQKRPIMQHLFTNGGLSHWKQCLCLVNVIANVCKYKCLWLEGKSCSIPQCIASKATHNAPFNHNCVFIPLKAVFMFSITCNTYANVSVCKLKESHIISHNALLQRWPIMHYLQSYEFIPLKYVIV